MFRNVAVYCHPGSSSQGTLIENYFKCYIYQKDFISVSLNHPALLMMTVRQSKLVECWFNRKFPFTCETVTDSQLQSTLEWIGLAKLFSECVNLLSFETQADKENDQGQLLFGRIAELPLVVGAILFVLLDATFSYTNFGCYKLAGLTQLERYISPSWEVF